MKRLIAVPLALIALASCAKTAPPPETPEAAAITPPAPPPSTSSHASPMPAPRSSYR